VNDFNMYYGLAQGRPMQQGLTAPAATGLAGMAGAAGMGNMSQDDLMELIRKMQQQKMMNQEMQTAMGLLNMAGPSIGAPAQMNIGSLLSLFGSK
jgi:hypothetical protein